MLRKTGEKRGQLWCRGRLLPLLRYLGNFAGSLDERRKGAQRLAEREERVLQQLRRTWPFICVHLERLREVVAENRRKTFGVCNGRRTVRCNQVQRLERVLVEIGWFPLDHFYMKNT